MSNPLKDLTKAVASPAFLGAALAAVVLFAVVVLTGGLITYLLVNALAAGSPLGFGKAIALTVLAYWTGAVVGAGARASK